MANAGKRNRQGPQGPQGESIIGPMGPRGDKGERGDRGPQGSTGGSGPSGDRGPMGYQGIQGEKGDKGDKGDPGEVSGTVPRIIDTFNTEEETEIGNLVRVTGSNFVSALDSNSSADIPNGAFGVAYSKPTDTTVQVLFLGSLDGYSGFTPSAPIFIDESGLPTDTPPSNGIVQQIGFAITPSAIFFNLLQPLRRMNG